SRGQRFGPTSLLERAAEHVDDHLKTVADGLRGEPAPDQHHTVEATSFLVVPGWKVSGDLETDLLQELDRRPLVDQDLHADIWHRREPRYEAREGPLRAHRDRSLSRQPRHMDRPARRRGIVEIGEPMALDGCFVAEP